MAQADTDNSTPAPAGLRSPQDWLYLPTDISPEEVFQAIGRLRKEARDEIDRLIRFIDKTDDYVSRELEDDDDREKVGDEEPSLGSFDRMTDQSKAWLQRGDNCHSTDAEQDNADHEDSDPAEESEASGIGDQDGLDEQVPFRDWQNVGMV
jgi:hypothetical protein